MLSVPPWKARQNQRHYCDKRCYATAHATTPKTCETCGVSFVAKNYSAAARYCSNACVPRVGEDNPNFGKRHRGMWQMPAERRIEMSEQRTGQGNPAWRGGSPTNGKFQHQAYVRAWALQHLPQACAVCGAPEVDLGHIVPIRHFRPRRLAHFAQNLLMLCRLHNNRAHWQKIEPIGRRRPADLPFADRLPRSILAALRRGDSVSAPLPGCDYSPLGNLVEVVVPQTAKKKAARRA